MTTAAAIFVTGEAPISVNINHWTLPSTWQERAKYYPDAPWWNRHFGTVFFFVPKFSPSSGVELTDNILLKSSTTQQSWDSSGQVLVALHHGMLTGCQNV